MGANMKILVINGPNLNFLGIREKAVYGNESYNTLMTMILKKGAELGVEVDTYQSNHEGAIIDRLQQAYYDKTDGVIINPGAYTHYSYAIHDALKSIFVPKVEVHISDINTREEWRRVSVTAPACDRQIVGHGFDGYLEAMEYIVKLALEK
jgi:3-dehydroquinate dehydratase-2